MTTAKPRPPLAPGETRAYPDARLGVERAVERFLGFAAADLAHLVPFRTAAFPFSDDVLHRIGLSLEWLPPSTRGNAHRCTIGMGTVCDDPDSDNETPLRLAPYDRRCLNFGGVALPKSYPRAAVSDIACSSLRYKSRQVRWHQWAGKRPADKSCPPNLRGRICRSDVSSVYSIL